MQNNVQLSCRSCYKLNKCFKKDLLRLLKKIQGLSNVYEEKWCRWERNMNLGVFHWNLSILCRSCMWFEFVILPHSVYNIISDWASSFNWFAAIKNIYCLKYQNYKTPPNLLLSVINVLQSLETLVTAVCCNARNRMTNLLRAGKKILQTWIFPEWICCGRQVLKVRRLLFIMEFFLIA